MGTTDMEKLLLFNVEQSETVIKFASNMRIKCSCVEASEYEKYIEELYNNNSKVIGENKENLTAPLSSTGNKKTSLIVFCNVSEKHFDKLLFLLRNSGITTDYKAVMTDTNCKWTVTRLLAEMEREKISIQKGRSML